MNLSKRIKNIELNARQLAAEAENGEGVNADVMRRLKARMARLSNAKLFNGEEFEMVADIEEYVGELMDSNEELAAVYFAA